MIHRRRATMAAFLLPAIAVYAVFMLYPLGRGIYLSMTDSLGGPIAHFVGTEQYRAMADDPDVTAALWHTIVYAAVVVIVQNGLGLLFASMLFRRPQVRKTLSVTLLTPTLVSPVMAAFIWSYLFAPDGGINALLGLLGLDSLEHVWLGDTSTALYAVAAVNIWMFAGYSCAIFLAGYMNLPTELLDAAAVDGANGWRRFRSIEWPMLAPALTVNVTLSLIGSLKVFEFPLVLTNGGPAGSTETLTTLVYRNVFGGGKFALGIAISVLLLVTVVVLSSATSSLLRLRERRI
ncbi:sugar ABC transporter permease [Streptomyces griseorubiginosus]|uniref:carbohydrate ABC transporter permease n=1 Tax=Streptomyces griseorubiginosus TaxID=67304 RepID=UPI002E8106B1|nr:sugar ABC transporter permease [Streptomyces griseorubiginosus]WUB49616.1 sugar ABC transporter permease [Streptomyces griseorubiginosus]WUB58145.1 sugar ABC transporter permease [Streptomyces griseorubiginosus]